MWSYVQKLLDDPSQMRIPQWFSTYKDQILSNIHNFNVIESYAIHHDVGKPYCITYDADGKTHYPNHAEVSKNLWLERGGDEITANLIGLDMVMHTESRDEILARQLSIKDTFTLLITALAEVHANAELFGGIESTSFKIKWKKLDKLGKWLCDKYFNHPYVYVIVRKDLSPAQKAVQSSHACIESAKNFMKRDDQHPSVIICEVRSEDKLKMVMTELDGKVNYKAFREPDIGNQYTALATEPIYNDRRKLFARFQLI